MVHHRRELVIGGKPPQGPPLRMHGLSLPEATLAELLKAVHQTSSGVIGATLSYVLDGMLMSCTCDNDVLMAKRNAPGHGKPTFYVCDSTTSTAPPPLTPKAKLDGHDKDHDMDQDSGQDRSKGKDKDRPDGKRAKHRQQQQNQLTWTMPSASVEGASTDQRAHERALTFHLSKLNTLSCRLHVLDQDRTTTRAVFPVVMCPYQPPDHYMTQNYMVDGKLEIKSDFITVTIMSGDAAQRVADLDTVFGASNNPAPHPQLHLFVVQPAAGETGSFDELAKMVVHLCTGSALARFSTTLVAFISREFINDELPIVPGSHGHPARVSTKFGSFLDDAQAICIKAVYTHRVVLPAASAARQPDLYADLLDEEPKGTVLGKWKCIKSRNPLYLTAAEADEVKFRGGADRARTWTNLGLICTPALDPELQAVGCVIILAQGIQGDTCESLYCIYCCTQMKHPKFKEAKKRLDSLWHVKLTQHLQKCKRRVAPDNDWVVQSLADVRELLDDINACRLIDSLRPGASDSVKRLLAMILRTVDAVPVEGPEDDAQTASVPTPDGME